MSARSSSDWNRIRRVFEEVLEFPEHRRSRELSRACEGDPELREKVEEMLVAHARGKELIKPLDHVGDLSASRRWIGREIGGYTIQRPIATGGMGAVFEAEQTHPRRSVALKMMRFGLATPEASRRFRFEAEVLGRLHHPNIAQIFEAGTWQEEDGTHQPFFAMEYIEDARNLIEYMQGEKLDLRACLTLFCTVCEAVQHGHEKGVIHRDLKPGNILVDNQGNPKVIDFGVARAADPDQTASALRTRGEYILGTLQYMAPEQLAGAGGVIDTRSDVYALGTVLYELLCGQPPFDFSRTPLANAARQLQEKEPLPPSAFQPNLSRDLDWIVMKSLSKEPARRYASASELAADLRRFLAYEPVLARPPSTKYRLSRFIRRHRLSVVATGLVLIALMGGLALAGIGLTKAKRALKEEQKAKRTAQEEATINERVANFLIDLFKTSNPRITRGEIPTVEQVLDRGAQTIKTGLEETPGVRGRLLSAMGESYLALGLYEKADPLLEQSIRDLEKSYGPTHRYALDTKNCLANSLLEQERYYEAERIFSEVIEINRLSLGEDHVKTIMVLGNLGLVYQKQERFEEAEEIYRSIIARREKFLEKYDADLVSALHNLGSLCTALNRNEEALSLYEEAVEVFRTTGDMNDHPDYFKTLNNLGHLYVTFNRYPEAEKVFRTALEGHKRIFGERHPLTFSITRSLAGVGWFIGREEESIALLQEVLEAMRNLLGPNHARTLECQFDLLAMFYSMSRFMEGEPVARDLLDRTGKENPNYAQYSTLSQRMLMATELIKNLPNSEKYPLKLKIVKADFPSVDSANIFRDDDGTLEDSMKIDFINDVMHKEIVLPFEPDEAESFRIWIYGRPFNEKGKGFQHRRDFHLVINHMLSNEFLFDVAEWFEEDDDNFRWAAAEVPKECFIKGRNYIRILFHGPRGAMVNNNLEVGVDKDSDFDRSVWFEDDQVCRSNECDGELMIFLEALME